MCVIQVCPVQAPQNMTTYHISALMSKGFQLSNFKQQEFVHGEVSHQINCGYIIILPCLDILALPGIQISPLVATTKQGSNHRLICYFNQSGLRRVESLTNSKDVLRFGKTLPHLLSQTLASETLLGTTSIVKVTSATIICKFGCTQRILI